MTFAQDDDEENDNGDDNQSNLGEDAFSIPSYAECLLLPDHALKDGLPEGWSCKMHNSCTADDAVEIRVYIHTDGKVTTIPHSTAAENAEIKDAYDELEAFIKRAMATTPINDWIDEKTDQKDDETIKKFHYVYTLCYKIKLANAKFLCRTLCPPVRTKRAPSKCGSAVTQSFKYQNT